MGPMKEWRCAAHGEFLSRTGRCPHKCGKRFVTQEFRTAPAVHGGTAKFIDGHLNDLAKTYNMTDIASAREGESVMSQLRRGKRQDYASKWGEIQVPHAPAGWTQKEGAKPSDAPRFHSPYGPGIDLAAAKSVYTPLPQMTTVVGRVKGE